MSGREVKETLESIPFVPLELVLSSGDRLIIRNPSLCILTKQGTLHAYHPILHEFATADGFSRIALSQIVQINELHDLAA